MRGCSCSNGPRRRSPMRPPVKKKGRRRFRFSLNALAIQLSAFAHSYTLVAVLVDSGSQAAFVEQNPLGAEWLLELFAWHGAALTAAAMMSGRWVPDLRPPNVLVGVEQGAILGIALVMIFINQIREKIGVMFGSPETTTAAPRSSRILRMRSISRGSSRET